MTYFLEVEAEGWPKYVGPFLKDYHASDWAKGAIRGGTWTIHQMVPPTLTRVYGKIEPAGSEA